MYRRFFIKGVNFLICDKNTNERKAKENDRNVSKAYHFVLPCELCQFCRKNDRCTPHFLNREPNQNPKNIKEKVNKGNGQAGPIPCEGS